MQKTISFLALLTAFLWSGGVMAQQTSSANANTTVKILKPISIQNIDKMDFGNIAVGTAAAIVKLGTNNIRQVVSGDVTLPSNTGSVTAASFKVKGEGGYTYTISITPATITLQDAASNSMTLDNFVPSPASGLIDAGTGEQMLYVGGNLNIGANQPSGVYNSTTNLQVTVQYN